MCERSLGPLPVFRRPQALEGYSGEILLVGANYDKDSENKPHSCVIEKMTLNTSQE